MELVVPAPYYTFRRIRYDWFEVSKWDYYSMTPEVTYTVLTSGRKSCNCLSYKRPCKHLDMVQWIGEQLNLHELAIDANGTPWKDVDL